MKHKVFIDGQAGTTGLEIHERLAARSDLEILRIEEDRRKDSEARRVLIDQAEVVFLCLPDESARESAALAAGMTRVIDASTAHRTAEAWAYGLPEMERGQRERIARAGRVSVPGCHATGFILALRPLVTVGIVPPDYPVTCHSITGYSGGGRKLIARYRAASERGKPYAGPRHYALDLRHKHLPEMQFRAGLTHPPLFTPIVGDFYRGMAVAVPLVGRLLPKRTTAAEIRDVLASYYQGERYVRVMPYADEALLDEGFLDPEACNGTNNADIFVFGHDEQVLLVTRLDNLGKGSSGAAVQAMNIMLGLDEGTGL